MAGRTALDQRGAGRQLAYLALALTVTLPGVITRLAGSHLPNPMAAALYGMAIVGAAFLLSWAAEAAQRDVSAGLAIAVLAFIAVLPEYAVGVVFAIKGGHAYAMHGASCLPPNAGAGQESDCALALANMTGANRLLIGVGWSMVVFLAWYRMRRRGERMGGIDLERSHSVELAFLSIATLYSLTIPLRRSITLLDAVVLVSVFAVYVVRISRAPAEEPDLVGPARVIGGFPTGRRRASVVALFAVAALVILFCAEHFAEALKETGAELGISEFTLVQWLAPLASEAPELLVAGLYAWRLNTNAGLGTLVSSKVNQWTLLVGTLPIAFALASGTLDGLPIIARQRQEVLLTAAQSFFAVAVLINLSMSLREAGFLFVLFWAQFISGGVVPAHWHGVELVAFSIVYLLLGVRVLTRNRREVPRLAHDGFVADYAELGSGPGGG